MHLLETQLSDVYLIEPSIFEDERGFFFESYHEKRAWEAGLRVKFVQDNHSFSKKGVLRGLHYQLKTPQAKLVRVITGEIFDVAIDIRQGSPTFGQWQGAYLSAANKRQLYIPPGFCHGFCVVSDSADVVYKCSAFYSPTDEYSLFWNDPDLQIKWPLQNPILSAKDQAAPLLKDAADHLPHYGTEA